MDVWRFHERSEELRKMVGVEHITTVIRSGRLRWYGHVMRTGWTCMEFRDEGRIPVGRPIRTWLESCCCLPRLGPSRFLSSR